MRRLVWILVICSLQAAVLAADNSARLVAAATAGRSVEVRDLLVGGIDANTKNATGRPVLVLAGFNGNRRTVQALLAAGADVNAVDANGTSALIAASARGHLDVVNALLDAGADVNLKDSSGRSAMTASHSSPRSTASRSPSPAFCTDYDSLGWHRGGIRCRRYTGML